MTKWNEEMPKRLLESMKKGHSFQASCADLGIHRDTGYEWVRTHEEFAKAKALGEQFGLKLYEQYMLAAITDYVPEELKSHGSKKFNVAGIIFMLKTRFHKIYGEKMKIETEREEVTLNIKYSKTPPKDRADIQRAIKEKGLLDVTKPKALEGKVIDV
jgi:transposase-like protein